MSSSRNYSSPPQDDSFISQRGTLNDAFLTRRDRMTSDEDGQPLECSRRLRVELNAVVGRNISAWDLTTQATIPADGWTTWSVGDREYRLKPYGVAFVGDTTADREPVVRFAVDRFENGHWIEWNSHCSNRFHDLKWNVSFEMRFLEFGD